jgi:hypothetical protein
LDGTGKNGRAPSGSTKLTGFPAANVVGLIVRACSRWPTTPGPKVFSSMVSELLNEIALPRIASPDGVLAPAKHCEAGCRNRTAVTCEGSNHGANAAARLVGSDW